MRAYMQISGALFGVIVGPSAPTGAALADRSSRIHGALVGFVAWTVSRWRPKYLGAAARARHVSRGLSHLSAGCVLTSACSWRALQFKGTLDSVRLRSRRS
jgi:hypothetical protein